MYISVEACISETILSLKFTENFMQGKIWLVKEKMNRIPMQSGV